MTYEVEVIRTATRTASIIVEACSAQQASILALEMAGGIDFGSEKDADYAVTSTNEKPDAE